MTIAPSETEARGAWWAPIVEFATHSVVGGSIFAVIAGMAALLHHYKAWLGDTTPYVRAGIGAAEYSIFTVDLILFSIFLLRTSWRAARRMIAGWND